MQREPFMRAHTHTIYSAREPPIRCICSAFNVYAHRISAHDTDKIWTGKQSEITRAENWTLFANFGLTRKRSLTISHYFGAFVYAISVAFIFGEELKQWIVYGFSKTIICLIWAYAIDVKLKSTSQKQKRITTTTTAKKPNRYFFGSTCVLLISFEIYTFKVEEDHFQANTRKMKKKMTLNIKCTEERKRIWDADEVVWLQPK